MHSIRYLIVSIAKNCKEKKITKLFMLKMCCDMNLYVYVERLYDY